MPHLIIESSLDIPKSTLTQLHQTVANQETVSIATVKTRLYSPASIITGDQTEKHHTAITLKLLSGRSPELKNTIAENILKKAQELITDGLLSVEVIDLGLYKKP